MVKTVTEKKKGSFKDSIDSLVVAFVIAMVIRAFILQAYKIPSESMLDTLLVGDHLIVNKLAYVLSEPERGDVIVFEYPLEPAKDYIKRVVGTPGDTLEVVNKKLFRNGEELNEPYTRFSSDRIIPFGRNAVRDNVAKFTVPEGVVFVMGDNRDDSFDSRWWGFVPVESIHGRAEFIYWSWETRGGIDIRFDRILKAIH